MALGLAYTLDRRKKLRKLQELFRRQRGVEEGSLEWSLQEDIPDGCDGSARDHEQGRGALDFYCARYQGDFERVRLPEYLMKGLFGFCDFYSKIIAIVEGLRGEDERTVELHERHHELNRYHSEEQTRAATSTVNWEPHGCVSKYRDAA